MPDPLTDPLKVSLLKPPVQAPGQELLAYEAGAVGGPALKPTPPPAPVAPAIRPSIPPPQTPGTTTPDLVAQAQRVRQSYASQATGLDKAAAAAIKQLSGEGKTIDQAMGRVREAQDKADAANTAALKAISNAPAQPDIDGFKHLNGLAMFVGIIGGLFTRSPMRSSLNAAASALEAYNDHDREKYEVAYKNWQTQTNLLFKISEMTTSRVKDVLYNEQMGLNERRAMLDATLRAAGLSQLADKTRTEGEATVLDWLTKMNSAQTAHTDHLAQIQSNNDYRMALLHMPKNQAQAVNEQIEAMDAEVFASTGQHIPPEERLKLINKYTRGNTSAGLSDDAADLIAQQIVAGQTNATVGLARRPEDMEKVRNAVAALTTKEADELGLPKEKRGELLAIRAAEFGGLQAGERTAAQQAARIGMANNEAQFMMPIAVAASEKVDRTQYPHLNSIIEAVDRGTGDENVVKFFTAVNSLVNAYARAVTPVGASTDDQRKHARDVLDAAYSKGQFRAATDTMKLEMQAALAAPGAVKTELRQTFTGTGPGMPAAPGASATLPEGVPPGSTLAGTSGGHPVYKTPDGKLLKVQ